MTKTCFALPIVLALLGTAAQAQSAAPQPATPAPAPAGADEANRPPKAVSDAPAPLVVLFRSGSSALLAADDAVLDRAARTYNEGKPFVMILTGNTDRVGSAIANLTLSQQRARAVLVGLLARGIPAEHFQVLAKGETEPPVPTKQGVAELRNRSVEITWR